MERYLRFGVHLWLWHHALATIRAETQTHASKKMLTRIKVACSMSGLCPAWWFYQWLVEARWPTSLFTKFCTFHPCEISAWTKTLISLRIIHLCMSVHNLHIIFIILSTNPEMFWAKSKWSQMKQFSTACGYIMAVESLVKMIYNNDIVCCWASTPWKSLRGDTQDKIAVVESSIYHCDPHHKPITFRKQLLRSWLSSQRCASRAFIRKTWGQ